MNDDDDDNKLGTTQENKTDAGRPSAVSSYLSCNRCNLSFQHPDHLSRTFSGPLLVYWVIWSLQWAWNGIGKVTINAQDADKKREKLNRPTGTSTSESPDASDRPQRAVTSQSAPLSPSPLGRTHLHSRVPVTGRKVHPDHIRSRGREDSIPPFQLGDVYPLSGTKPSADPHRWHPTLKIKRFLLASHPGVPVLHPTPPPQ